MRINLKSSLKRIEELSNYTSQKGGIPVIVSLEDWIEGSYEGSFHDYVTKLERNNPNSTIIVDDMLLETDMYLPSYIFFDRDKRTIEKFIDLAN